MSSEKKPQLEAVNEFVIKFANVNGSGSASANTLFAKSIFRSGVPVSPRNIFPSNIQGLPTWYEVRVSEKGYLAKRGGGVDIMVSVNPQSMLDDVQEVLPGGYFFYDDSKPLDIRALRRDIHYLGIPLTDITNREYDDARLRQLFKNVIYIGALAALLDIQLEVVESLIAEQFARKEKLIKPNCEALRLGYETAKELFSCPLPIRVESRDLVGDRIMMTGNSACGLGAVYAGATVAAWYPITPSTSVAEAFEKYASQLRYDKETDTKRYVVIQAEDELAAMGMVIGANWNGARSFTATSGPGVSLMTEFLGLAYFAEVPAVLIDVQRAGPSTGMPTRTQQGDILSCVYASHGDTRHVCLFPADPHDCFNLTINAFDLAERLQTPIIMLTDLDVGMNDCLCDPLEWDDSYQYDRGKVLNREELDSMERFGRYKDVDGDNIPWRTLPGTHPEKGAFFTRGTSRDEYAIYTEKGSAYQENMERLLAKWYSAPEYLPKPVIRTVADASTGIPKDSKSDKSASHGFIFYGTSRDAVLEAVDQLHQDGEQVDTLQIMAVPFHDSVRDFIDTHPSIVVIEQNRDAQMRTVLMNELDCDPLKLRSVLHYNGDPISAQDVLNQVRPLLSMATPEVVQ